MISWVRRIVDRVRKWRYSEAIAKGLGAELHKRAPGLQAAREKLKEEPARETGKASYLEQLAARYVRVDFRGLGPMEELRSVRPPEMETVFVERRARPQPRAEPAAASGGRETRPSDGHSTEPPAESVDCMLAPPGATVLLGGPGSGKTTLVKRLVRLCALGREALEKHYPQMPWCFPISTPMASLDAQRGEREILPCLEDQMRQQGGEALLAAFRQYWKEARCLIVLDGLDEVADEERRIDLSKLVDGFIPMLAGNRLLVTSRPVGYASCRLAEPANEYLLEPFDRRDIESFARAWDPELGDELIDDIDAHPQIESLVQDPLMLTICALIKRSGERLPDRRVELYGKALEVLLEHWDKGRSLSLSRRGMDSDEREPRTMTASVLSEVAYWMHGRAGSGRVRKADLEKKLVDVLGRFVTEVREAHHLAEAYLRTASESSGLLQVGSQGCSFVHATFEEYLAALHLVRPPIDQAIQRIWSVRDDPRWHEPIRLAAGQIGDTATELIEKLLDDDDPLEPLFHGSLLLAASCLADGVPVEETTSDRVITAIFEHSAPLGKTFPRGARQLMDLLPSISVVPGPAAVDYLTERVVGHRHWRWGRLEATRLLGCLEPARLREIRETFEMLREDKASDGNVRALAALALWSSSGEPDYLRQMLTDLPRLGSKVTLHPTPRLLSGLREVLDDESPSVWSRAAALLGEWGQRDAAVPRLRGLLGSDDVRSRVRAAELLGLWGDAGAVLNLVELSRSQDGHVQRVAIEALSKVAAPSRPIAALVRMLDDDEPRVVLAAAEVLGAWDRQAEAWPKLVKLLEHESPVPDQASGLLARWKPVDALPDLLRLMQSDDVGVLIHAVEILEHWEPQPDAIPTLATLLDHDDVRLSAARVLARWGPPGKAAEKLARYLDEKREKSVLGQLADGRPQPLLVPVLVDMMRGSRQPREAADLVHYAALTLIAWGKRESALTELREMLGSRSDAVRTYAAQVLASWDDEEALPTLLELLGHDGPSIRRKAAGALRNWGDSEIVRGAVLEALGDDAGALEPFFDRRGIGAKHGQNRDSLRHAVADAIRPREGDSKRKEALRGIVRHWLAPSRAAYEELTRGQEG